jgi:hypothetical protein
MEATNSYVTPVGLQTVAILAYIPPYHGVRKPPRLAPVPTSYRSENLRRSNPTEKIVKGKGGKKEMRQSANSR